MSELRWRAAAAWAAVWLVACSAIDTVAFPAAGPDAAACSTEPPGAVTLDAGGAALPPKKFPFALCACESYEGSAPLTVDAFDGLGPYTRGGAGGSVGINGQVTLEATADVGGALIAAGAAGIALGAETELRTASALACGGDLNGPGARVLAGADASIAGDIALGALEVRGTITYPAGRTLSVAGSSTAGATQRAPVQVAPPCPCAEQELFDAAASAPPGGAPDDDGGAAQPHLDGAGGLEVLCGSYDVSELQMDGDLDLHVPQRSVLYVAGDLSVGGSLTITLAQDAELDLFVGGDLRVAGGLRAGTAGARGPVRLYIAGAGPIELATPSELHGVLYAPRAELVSSADFTVYGALFVRRVRASGRLELHYDERFAPGN